MRRGNSIKGRTMDISDYGKSAMCGVDSTEVIVSKYNAKCPCLNCLGCKNVDEKTPCAYRHVLEISPCTNEDMREILCVNCIGKQR